MLMSQAAISAASIGLPRLGPAARQPKLTAKIDRAAVSLCVDMAYRPGAADRPAGHAVVVLAREGGDRRYFRALPPHRDDLGAGRLHVARLVPRPAFQHGGGPHPAPRGTGTRKRPSPARVLERRLGPALARGGADPHLPESAVV